MPTADELKDKGIKQFMQQDYEQATGTFQQAIDAYKTGNMPDMVAEMQVNLGLALHMAGRPEEALEQMEMARTVFTGMNDQLRTAQVLGNMARVYAKLGNNEQAITNYREASSMFLELNDEENYGQTVLAIADLQMRSGNMMQALATYEIGLDYVKHPNSRQKIMKNLLGLKNKITGTGSDKSDEPKDE